jgi:hypothetical protein
MQSFKIHIQSDQNYLFELGEICITVKDYEVKEEGHIILEPEKAYAYFYNSGNMYGVANNIKTFNTVEEFYQSMLVQYNMVKSRELSLSIK